MLTLNKCISCKRLLTLNKREPLCPVRSLRQVFGYQFFQFGGGGVQGWVVESCRHDLGLHVTLPVVGEGRDHLSRELTTQVTVEDLRESEHCKHVTGGEVEREEKREGGRRRGREGGRRGREGGEEGGREGEEGGREEKRDGGREKESKGKSTDINCVYTYVRSYIAVR